MASEPTDDVVLCQAGPPRWGWASIAHPDPENYERHLMPMLDVGTHAFDVGCPCGPICDVPGSVIHFAFDGREAYEQGLRKRH